VDALYVGGGNPHLLGCVVPGYLVAGVAHNGAVNLGLQVELLQVVLFVDLLQGGFGTAGFCLSLRRILPGFHDEADARH